jgi:hypothetical protein
VVGQIISVATFDIPFIEMDTLNYIHENAFTVGEDPVTLEEPHNYVVENFDELGYGSPYLSANMGSMFVYYVITLFALLFIFVGWATRRCGNSFVIRQHEKLKKIFLWNFCIRLIFEASLELSFCIGLNWKYGVWGAGNWADDFCSINTMMIAVLLLIMPFGIYCFYTKKFEHLADEEFEEKYGAVYEGLLLKKKSMLIFPILFVVRRMVFALICLTLYANPIV